MCEVSIIIINYNTFEVTCECIRSVVEKTREVTYEIIVVDNASQDVSPDGFLTVFPSIHLIKSKVNLGFSGGNNLGIRQAKGNCILLLNSDTVLKNNAVKISCDKLTSTPTVGVVSCKLLYPDGRVQPVAGRFPSLKRELKNLLRLNKHLSPQQRAEIFLGTEFDYKTEREADWVWGAFFMFPRKLLGHFENGLLPADYFMYMEDVLWCYRIKQLGYRVFYIPGGEVYHLMAGSSIDKDSGELERYAKRILPNEYNFLVKTKGFVYAKCYYFIKALNHLSHRTKHDRIKSKIYFSFFFR
jgi:hypothetical protein